MAQGQSLDLLTYFNERTEAMVAFLRRLVEMESPSHDKAAVDALGQVIAQEARSRGATVQVVRQERWGDHLIARWPGQDPRVQFLILCHMDTVWPVGRLAEQPVTVRDGRIYGPGTHDMKGGIVITLTALQGLRELGLEPLHPVTVLFTSDEEVGSQTSQALIEAEARRSRLVCVMEPATPEGGIKTARKGTGIFTVVARGVAAHAGAAHDQGVNAIEELAHQILTLQGMTDYARGTTVNVGVVRGGERRNIVPDWAEVLVDLRVSSRAEGERMVRAIQELTPRLPGARLEVRGELRRPPMERDARMVATFQRAQAIASRLGIVLREGSSGGASDGNFTAAMGVPTLDGMGTMGDGAHAVHEHVLIPSLPERAALLAAILTSWDEAEG